MDPEDSILQVKTRIRRKSNISTEGQCLIFAGEELVDTKKLSHYKIDEGDVLLLEPFKINVLDLDGQMFDLDGINNDSTVDEIKKRIEELKSISTSEQVLKVDNLPIIDSLRLRDQGIHHASIIVLDTNSTSHHDSDPRRNSEVKIDVPESRTKMKCLQDLQEGDNYTGNESQGEGNDSTSDDSPSIRSTSTRTSTTRSSSSKQQKPSDKKKEKKRKKAKKSKPEEKLNEKRATKESRKMARKLKKDSKK